jgi:RNA polymerase sigma-70 factor (ECF subfamily)
MGHRALDSDKDPDLELIRKTAEGDESAFEQLISKHEDTVYNTAYHYVGNAEEAEDVAQEVFVKVWRHAGSFRGSSKFSTWLYRIVVNQCLNHRRRKKRDPAPLDSEASQHLRSESLEEDFEKKAQVEAVRRAIDSLPRRQRLALVLAKCEERSYKEIAEIMGVSLSSVESLIHRARTTLRKRLLPQLKRKNQ